MLAPTRPARRDLRGLMPLLACFLLPLTLACEEDKDHDGSAASIDCNDRSADTHPGAHELCNGKDDNCDKKVDEGYDGDHDGHNSCSSDCDDRVAATYLGATEVCDGRDNDCDNQIDEGEWAVALDRDGDGWGEEGVRLLACGAIRQEIDNIRASGRAAPPPGGGPQARAIRGLGALLASNESGASSSVHHEKCDPLPAADLAPVVVDPDLARTAAHLGHVGGIPNRAGSGVREPAFVDASCARDCDDRNDAIHPWAGETCNGKDDDCDGRKDIGQGRPIYQDMDGDGFGGEQAPGAWESVCDDLPRNRTLKDGDCDDGDPTAHVAAAQEDEIISLLVKFRRVQNRYRGDLLPLFALEDSESAQDGSGDGCDGRVGHGDPVRWWNPRCAWPPDLSPFDEDFCDWVRSDSGKARGQRFPIVPSRPPGSRRPPRELEPRGLRK